MYVIANQRKFIGKGQNLEYKQASKPIVEYFHGVFKEISSFIAFPLSGIL